MNFLYFALAFCLCLTTPALAQQAPVEHLFMDAQGAWGVVDANNEWIVPPLYDTLFYLNSTAFDAETYKVSRYKSDYLLAKSKQNQRWHLLHKNGGLRYKADAIMPRLMGDVILVKKNNKWGLVATNGNVLLPVKCTKIAWHEDVLALQDKKGKWCLFDPQNGRLEKHYKLDKVTLLSAPNKPVFLLVEQDGKQGVWDQYFRTVVPLEYPQIVLHPAQQGYVYYVDEQGTCGTIHLKSRRQESTPCRE